MDLYDGNEYRATTRWPYSIGAGCVVFRLEDGMVEVLLLVRDASPQFTELNQGLATTYHIPKGHANVDETLQQSAIRETAEEAGVDVNIRTYLGTKTDTFVHPKANIKNVKTVHYFAAEWLGDSTSGDHEHSSKTWVTLDEAKKLLGAPNPKGEDEIIERLKKYLELMEAKEQS